MNIEIVNAFCNDSAESGNPCAVVRNFHGDNESKQKIAAELKLPVTVFVSIAANPSLLEFYYPNKEMPLCLHGTLGAAFVMFRDTTDKELIIETKSKFKLNVKRNGNLIRVRVSKQFRHANPVSQSVISEMLKLKNIDEIDNSLPLTVASVGSSKLLVPIKSFDILASLTPNFGLIDKWSKQNNINGLYVYTHDIQDNALDFYARAYNPGTGHNEDVATGVAAAALSATLQRSIVVGQGIFLNSCSEIHVVYEDDETIWVGGRVISSVNNAPNR